MHPIRNHGHQKEVLHNGNNTHNSGMIRELWVLGAPTILEQALQTVVVYVDTAMVGHIGAKASAAVGLTTTVNWLFNGIFFAVSVGLLSFIARYTGEGNTDAAKRTSSQGIWVVIALGIIETAIALGISPYLPEWMDANEEIRRDASMYFFITSIPMLLKGTLIVFGNILRANKDTKTPMRINVGVNLLNIMLNQLLIGSGAAFTVLHRTWRLPGAGLGVTGAAIATAVSQGLGGILIFAAAMRNPLTTLKGQDKRPDRQLLGNCFRVALPLMGERLVIGGGHVAFSALVAGLGTLSTAAHSIAITIEEAFYVPGYGIQTAVSTLAGNAAGRKNNEELKRVTKAGLYIAVTVMSLMAVFLFFASPLIMMIFSNDESVVALGAAILKIVAVSEPLFATFIIFEGVFHGIGETKVPFMIGLFTMWGIRIFMTWLLTSSFHCGLKAVWVCMVMDNVMRCILLVIWYHMGKWKKRLDMER